MTTSWIQLTDEKQFENIISQSMTKPVVLFKHSIRCGISLHAMSRLEDKWDFSDKELDFYYLDLLNYRPLSNKIAQDFNVIHQSPQLVVIKNGKATYNVSHQAISVADLRENL